MPRAARVIALGDIWGDVAAPAPPTGPIGVVTAPVPVGPTSGPTAPALVLGPTLAVAPAGAATGLSVFGRAWWTAMRPQTTQPLVQALRILMEGETPTATPSATDPRLAARGPADPLETYHALAWLFEWPDDVLLAVIPGATVARITAARAALRPPVTDRQIRLDRVERLRARRAALVAERTRLERLLGELARSQAWVGTVLQQFDVYVRWFEHHQEKKDVRVANVSKVLQAVSTVVSFVPVVGTAIAIAVTAVDVGLQYRRMRESLHDFARAGGTATAGFAAVAALEAIEVAGVELLAAHQALTVEIENTEAQLAILDPATPVGPAALLPALPRAGRGGLGLVAAAATVLVLWWWSRR